MNEAGRANWFGDDHPLLLGHIYGLPTSQELGYCKVLSVPTAAIRKSYFPAQCRSSLNECFGADALCKTQTGKPKREPLPMALLLVR